jgi:hypothetical protein
MVSLPYPSASISLTRPALLIALPSDFFLLARMLLIVDMNKVYGFEGEAKSKYGDMTYKLFADVFTARTSSSYICSSTYPPQLNFNHFHLHPFCPNLQYVTTKD